MMRPPRGSCAFMILIASWVQRNGPVRLVATTECQRSSGMSSSGMPRMLTPALLNKRSSRPKASLVLANKRDGSKPARERRWGRRAWCRWPLSPPLQACPRAGRRARPHSPRATVQARRFCRRRCRLRSPTRSSARPSAPPSQSRHSGSRVAADPESITTDCGISKGPSGDSKEGGYASGERCAHPGMTACSTRERDFLVGLDDAVIVRSSEPSADVRGRAGPAEAVALHRVHAGGAQEQMLFRSSRRPRPSLSCQVRDRG